MSIKVLILVSFVCIAKPQLIKRGFCPTVEVKEDLDLNQYRGKWYEIQRTFAIFEAGLDCVTTEYEKQDGGISVLKKGIRSDGSVSSRYGTGRPANDSSNEGKLILNFEEMPFELEYWILDTDYKTYSIEFSCSNVWFLHSENLWILSRQPTLSTESLSKIYKFLDQNGVARGGLVRVTQTCNETVVE